MKHVRFIYYLVLPNCKVVLLDFILLMIITLKISLSLLQIFYFLPKIYYLTLYLCLQLKFFLCQLSKLFEYNDVMPLSCNPDMPSHVIPILISTSSNQTSNNYLFRSSYKTIAYSTILWCQTHLRINPQSRSWQWLRGETSFLLKATALLEAQWYNEDGNSLRLCSTFRLPRTYSKDIKARNRTRWTQWD